jgi:hypothetical protein
LFVGLVAAERGYGVDVFTGVKQHQLVSGGGMGWYQMGVGWAEGVVGSQQFVGASEAFGFEGVGFAVAVMP